MEITFRTKNVKQGQACEKWMDDETEQILYGGAKGGGKSFLGVSLIFGDALLYPETHYFIARKELNDLRKFTIPTIHEVFQKMGMKIDEYASFNGQDNFYKLHNGSKVFLIACKDEPSDPLFERFGSMQMTRGMIEEGGEVPEAAKENLWLSIGRWKNDVFKLKKKLIITANPKKGWMKREFVDPYFAGVLPKVKCFIQAFASDNKHLPEGYVETLSNIKDPVARQRLFEGSWDYDESKDSLVTFDAMTDCFSNTLVKSGERYLIVDVARKGKDSTTFSLWDDLELYRVEKFQKQTTEKTEQAVKDYAAMERVPFSNILIDEDGIGGGVVDHLFGVKGFTANSTPLPTAYEIRTRESKVLNNSLIPKTSFANLKAQCGWKAAELINEKKMAFKVPDYRDEIIGDLSALLRQRNVDGEGKKQLIPKDEVKQTLGHSPDLGDTIIYRAFFELIKIAAREEDPRVKQVAAAQRDHMEYRRSFKAERSNK